MCRNVPQSFSGSLPGMLSLTFLTKGTHLSEHATLSCFKQLNKLFTGRLHIQSHQGSLLTLLPLSMFCMHLPSLISTAVLQLCNLRQLEFAGDLCMHPLPDLKASHLTALTLQQSAEEAELEQLLDTYTNLKHLGVWLPEATSHGFQKPCRSSIVIMHRIQLAIQQWVMAGGAGDGHLWLMEHLPLPLRRTAQALAMALSHHG